MQKIVTDRLRPEGSGDAFGVGRAREMLTTAYGLIDRQMAVGGCAMGGAFTLADCAAAPALYYAATLEPFPPAQRGLAASLARLRERPSSSPVLHAANPRFAR